MQYIYLNNGKWCWNPSEVRSAPKSTNLYLIHENMVNIFYQKPINISNRHDQICYYDNIGFNNVRFMKTKGCNMLCIFCSTYGNAFIFTYESHNMAVCEACKKQPRNKQTIYVNDKFDNIGPVVNIIIYTKCENFVGFYKIKLKSDLFDFMNIINISWFNIKTSNTCQLCEVHIKYNNYVCKQCYDFSYNNLFKDQLCKIMFIKYLINLDDIYNEILYMFLNFLYPDLGKKCMIYVRSLQKGACSSPKDTIPIINNLKITESDTTNTDNIIEVFNDNLDNYEGLGHWDDDII